METALRNAFLIRRVIPTTQVPTLEYLFALLLERKGVPSDVLARAPHVFQVAQSVMNSARSEERVRAIRKAIIHLFGLNPEREAATFLLDSGVMDTRQFYIVFDAIMVYDQLDFEPASQSWVRSDPIFKAKTVSRERLISLLRKTIPPAMTGTPEDEALQTLDFSLVTYSQDPTDKGVVRELLSRIHYNFEASYRRRVFTSVFLELQVPLPERYLTVNSDTIIDTEVGSEGARYSDIAEEIYLVLRSIQTIRPRIETYQGMATSELEDIIDYDKGRVEKAITKMLETPTSRINTYLIRLLSIPYTRIEKSLEASDISGQELYDLDEDKKVVTNFVIGELNIERLTYENLITEEDFSPLIDRADLYEPFTKPVPDPSGTFDLLTKRLAPDMELFAGDETYAFRIQESALPSAFPANTKVFFSVSRNQTSNMRPSITEQIANKEVDVVVVIEENKVSLATNIDAFFIFKKKFLHIPLYGPQENSALRAREFHALFPSHFVVDFDNDPNAETFAIEGYATFGVPSANYKGPFLIHALWIVDFVVRGITNPRIPFLIRGTHPQVISYIENEYIKRYFK